MHPIRIIALIAALVAFKSASTRLKSALYSLDDMMLNGGDEDDVVARAYSVHSYAAALDKAASKIIDVLCAI